MELPSIDSILIALFLLLICILIFFLNNTSSCSTSIITPTPEIKSTCSTPTMNSSTDLSTDSSVDNLSVKTPSIVLDQSETLKCTKTTPVPSPSAKISFNDNDLVLDLETNKKSTINAPKTLERLEKISQERHTQRKLENEQEDDEDDDENFDDIPLVIHKDIKLNLNNIENLDKTVNIKKDPILNDIEVLI